MSGSEGSRDRKRDMPTPHTPHSRDIQHMCDDVLRVFRHHALLLSLVITRLTPVVHVKWYRIYFEICTAYLYVAALTGYLHILRLCILIVPLLVLLHTETLLKTVCFVRESFTEPPCYTVP